MEWTEADVKRAQSMRDEGMIYKAIGKVFGCSRTTVMRHILGKKAYTLKAHRESARRYREKYPERARECLRSSYRKYKDQRCEQNKEYRRLNRDTINETKRKYRNSHKDFVREKQRAWRNTPRGREWYRLHEQWKRSAKRIGDGISLGAIERMWNEQEGRCAYCGCKMLREGNKNDPQYMTVDHIIPLAKGGPHSENNIVLACRSCNSKKGARTRKSFELQLQLQKEGGI